MSLFPRCTCLKKSGPMEPPCPAHGHVYAGPIPVTEPTPKPTDALDLLKKLAGGVDPEKCSPFQAMAREWAIEAAEAWEKERAEHELRRGALMRSAELNGEKTGELIALRAALERIEGEMRALSLPPVNRTDRRERGTMEPKCDCNCVDPDPSGCPVHGPPEPPRVEDSHAKLAADIRLRITGTVYDAQVFEHTLKAWAARVEALGSIGLVREGPRDVAQASARSGENVQSAQGRVEEKKAAAARRAIQALEQRCGEGWTGPNWEQEEQADRDAIEVLRALVESESASESP